MTSIAVDVCDHLHESGALNRLLRMLPIFNVHLCRRYVAAGDLEDGFLASKITMATSKSSRQLRRVMARSFGDFLALYNRVLRATSAS